jgi:DNA-binding CsgD family transcriptional regulator/tetratricopeptide (TPR) repeat protein
MSDSGRLIFAGSAPPLLVGREREQAIVRDHLANARDGHGSLILIGGEAGIGKTALAEALCREAEEQGALVLVGRCYDLTETPPYGPWLELFARYQPGNDLPALPPSFATPGALHEVISQAALFTQARDFLTTLAIRQPLLLLLDDVHWADPASLDLLRFLARSLPHHRLLLVVTFRDDEVTRHHPLYGFLPVLEREASAVRIGLRPLHSDALRTLVSARYRLLESDAAPLVTSLQERAEGNAFFTMQLLRAFEEEAVLRYVDDGWIVGDLTAVRVPVSLRQVIDRRLARLGEEAQHLLTVAAVIGQEVSVALWAAVAAIGEDALLTVIERAVEAHLLDETPDGTRVRFVHALIREALYERVLAARRRLMHLAVAETMLATGIPAPDAVAAHFQQAGDRRAIEWLIRAGERAEQAYAWLTAADRFSTALVLMEQGGGEPQERGWLLFHLAMLTSYADHARTIAHLDEATRLAEIANDRTLLAYATCRRGWVRCNAGDPGRGLPEFEAGIAALDALPEDEQIPHVTLGEVLRGHNDRALLVVFLAQAGRYKDAQAVAQQAIARGGEVSRAYFGMGLVYAGRGRLEEARRSFDVARAGLRTLGHTHIEGWVAHYELAWVVLAYQTDRLEERQQLTDTARQAWAHASSIERNIIPDSALLALQFVEANWRDARVVALAARAAFGTAASAHVPKQVLGDIARAQGDVDLAWTVVREQLPAGIDTAYGDINFISALGFQRLAASLALDQGDLGTAQAWLETHDRWLAWNSAVLGQSEGHALWAGYYRAANNMKRAYHHATRSLACATEPRQPLALLAAHRLLGELNTATGRIAYAATHLDAALSLATACAAPYERALTLLALAELRAATGQRAEASALLNGVRTICTPLGAALALTKADTLAARLAGAAAVSPVSFPAGLSVREVEVLQRVAAGESNRDIADALFLSERTVQVHVRHILTKTGADNRAAATAFALRNNLA